MIDDIAAFVIRDGGTEEMKKNKKHVVLIGVILVLGLIAAGIYAMTADSAERKLEEQLELGKKYLDELDYEQAIVAYKAAIKIDSKCEEAYLTLAEIYVTMEDYENAIDILNQGIEQTSSEKLVQYLAEVEAIYGYIGKADEMQVTDTSDEFSPNDRIPEKKIINYNADGSINWYEVAEYDEDGNEVKLTAYNADGSMGGYWEYEYDENGNKVKENIYNADGSMDAYWVYKYDGNGNKVEWNCYDADGSITHKYAYEYDGNGDIVKQTLYNADGSIHWDLDCVREYDGNGNNVKWTGYNTDGNMYEYGVREYDGHGNMVKQTSYNPDGSIQGYSVYEYDGNGNKVKWTYHNADGSMNVEEYDGNGNEIKWTNYNADGSIESYTMYEYE